MTTYELLILVTGVVSAVGGVGFVVVMVQTYKGQMNAQVFTDCNDRYDQILASFPRSAWESRLNLGAGLPDESMELTLCVLRYLNLSSEEFYLYRRGYLRREVWDIWEGELLRTLRSPLLRREWKTLRQEFISYPEFSRYVEDAQGREESPARGERAGGSNGR
jgi:hypothetical protein